MKKRNLLVLIFLLTILLPASLFSQTPMQCVNYQAVIRDSSNRLIINRAIVVQVSLTDSSGVAYYQEEHQTKTNQQGLVTLKIGCGTAMSGDFFSVPWDNANIKAEYDIDTDGFYDLLGVGTISAVPYALYAENVKPLQHIVDSIIQNINTISDSIKNYLTADSIQRLVSDSIAEFLTSDSVQRLLKDSISHFLTSDSIQRLVSDSLVKFITFNNALQILNLRLAGYVQLSELCMRIATCSAITQLQASVSNNILEVRYSLRDSMVVLRDSITKLRNTVNVLNRERSLDYYVIVEGTTEFPLNGHPEPREDAVIKGYVNGIRVRELAWSYNSDNRKFYYDSTRNYNYEMQIGDKIIIEYFY